MMHITPWIERVHAVSTSYENQDAMQAEIAELRAALASQGEQARAVNQGLLEALQEFVANSHEQDVGGGDIVVTTCESRALAVSAIAAATNEQS